MENIHKLGYLLACKANLERLVSVREGMIAENKIAETTGRALPYHDSAFFTLSDEMQEIVNSLNQTFTDGGNE